MSGTTNVSGGGPPGDISFNYVPLIDVTFNLIIFFVLTSEIGIAQKARIRMPDPYEPQAVKRANMSTNSVVIAVISAAAYESNVAATGAASRALKYELDGQEFPITDLKNLVEMIGKRKEAYERVTGAAAKGEFFVEVRADARIHFSEIRPIIEAIARANIPKMAITARKAA